MDLACFLACYNACIPRNAVFHDPRPQVTSMFRGLQPPSAASSPAPKWCIFLLPPVYCCQNRTAKGSPSSHWEWLEVYSARLCRIRCVPGVHLFRQPSAHTLWCLLCKVDEFIYIWCPPIFTWMNVGPPIYVSLTNLVQSSSTKWGVVFSQIHPDHVCVRWYADTYTREYWCDFLLRCVAMELYT